ncbi:hypothetical protein BGX28_010107 [Mortierella sp. GBA30]|nr:hypothetical protein BGX28_010107 [Mortierella sp. GBA30]
MMPSTHRSLLDVLESIPHAAERPRPQGTLAAKHWTGLLLEVLLHPKHWHKLGFAVQWAKWIEWEGGLDLKSPIRSPGILYLQNPLHPFTLNQLLNLLDFAVVDVETLIGCVDTGEWNSLFKETTDPSLLDLKTREQASESLEQLCLLSFYLRYYVASSHAECVRGAGTDPKEQEEDRLIQDLVSRVLNDVDIQEQDLATGILGAGTSSDCPAGPHQPAAASHLIYIRVYSAQWRSDILTPTAPPHSPSKFSLILNELLEFIRYHKIRLDGWADPTISDKLSDAQFQQLGRLLSTSFFTIIEFADVSLFLPVENIVFLGKFAAQLPASWYSDDFLRTTISMARRYIATEQCDKFRIPSQVEALVAIATLWSFWMRKTGSSNANILGQELVEILAQILTIPSLFTGPESRGLFGACFSGLATGLDKWSGSMEPKIVDGLVAGLEHGRVSTQDSDMDGIQASLATVLRSNILDQKPDSIKRLVTAFLQSFYGTMLGQPIPASNVDELFQIQRLMQFVVTQKAGLAPVKEEEEDKKKQRKKRKSKKAVNLRGLAWFDALVHGVQDISTTTSMPSLLAVAGILRAIQHGEDKAPKVDAESLSLIQDLFIAKLKEFANALKTPETQSSLPFQTQACLVFATSQTIPSLPECKLDPSDCSLLANLLVDFMLQPNEGVVPLNEILRVITYEMAKERNRLPLHGDTNKMLTRTVRGLLFSEMGRIARTLATLIEGMSDWGQIEDILQRMHSFAINLHVDWGRCGLSQTDSFIERREADAGLDPETAKAMGMLFQVFKTVLFAYTMIFGSVVEKSSSDPVPAGDISRMDYLMLESFAYLYFITYKLGPGGFQVHEDLITAILTRMVVAEGLTLVQHQQEQQQQEHNDDSTIQRHVLLNKTLKAMMPRAELGFHDPVMESRTLFFMNILERSMIAIDEQFLENLLLPMVYPYLLKNDQRDLFESAHSVVMAVFLTRKRIAKNVAPFYSNLLLQHFPQEINIDQLRAAFTTMIRSLSETEDAMAWLCVERLLEKIQEYDDLAEAEAQTDVESRAVAISALKEEQQDMKKEKVLEQVCTPATMTRAVPTSFTGLQREKERGQLLLALFDQLSSVNLVFVETLGQQIRALLIKEIPTGRKALLKCLLDVIGGPAVDHTKRDWAVKWYLGLVNEFGHPSTALSTAASH